MPQLDKLTYLAQYVWLTVFFWIIYLLFSTIILPYIFTGLRLRSLVSATGNNFFKNFRVGVYRDLWFVYNGGLYVVVLNFLSKKFKYLTFLNCRLPFPTCQNRIREL